MMTPFDEQDILPSAIPIADDGVIFDIDPFKESLEHISKNDETIAEMQIDEDNEVYYKPLPTSESLNRICTISRSSTSSSSGSSVSFSEEDLVEPKPKTKLPAMEAVIKQLGVIQQRQQEQEAMKKKPATTNKSTPKKQNEDTTIDYSMETQVSIELYTSSITQDVNIKEIAVNHLGPREQEEAGTISYIIRSHSND